MPLRSAKATRRPYPTIALLLLRGILKPQYALGVCNNYGNGVTLDFKEAMRLYRLARGMPELSAILACVMLKAVVLRGTTRRPSVTATWPQAKVLQRPKLILAFITQMVLGSPKIS